MGGDKAGGTAPRAKFPRRPLSVSGFSIIRPLLKYFFQHMHLVQVRPVFQHLRSFLNGPLVKQVKCLVQIQHRPTCFQD